MKYCLACHQPFESVGWACPGCGWKPNQKNEFFCFYECAADANKGFEPALFEQLSQIEPGHYWFEHRNRVVGEFCADLIAPLTSFMEIGRSRHIPSNVRQRDKAT